MKSLPERMREAADTLEEATMRGDFGSGVAPPDLFRWSASMLRDHAEGFEREDSEYLNGLVDLIRDGRAGQFCTHQGIARAILAKYNITPRS